MSSITNILAILATLLFMAGCGVQQNVKPTDITGYPHRYAAFDYKYAWKTTQTDHGVVIDGIMKNVRYPYIDSVQLTVFVLGKDGKTITRETTFPMPQQTREDDVCSYSLLLKNVKPVAGDQWEFHVHYTGSEGGNDGGGVDWINSFKVDALTGAVISQPGSVTNTW